MKRALAIVALMVASGCSPNVATSTATAKPDSSRFLLGAATYTASGFQQATGVRPAIVEHYVHPGAAFNASFAGNAIPLIQIMPFSTPLSAVTDGHLDAWLRSYARAVAEYQRPVILSFAPEMNGPWYSWGDTHASPARYIAAWRHIVTVFRAQGARNTIWMWTVNVQKTTANGKPTNGVAAATPWWPGTAWADWVGIDGYYDKNSETFKSVFSTTFAQIRALTQKPVLIAETAAAATAGKASKIPDLFAGARAEKAIGLVWFDLPGNRNWLLDNDPAALTAFRAAAARYS